MWRLERPRATGFLNGVDWGGRAAERLGANASGRANHVDLLGSLPAGVWELRHSARHLRQRRVVLVGVPARGRVRTGGDASLLADAELRVLEHRDVQCVLPMGRVRLDRHMLGTVDAGVRELRDANGDLQRRDLVVVRVPKSGRLLARRDDRLWG